jgi:MFS family permease
MLYTPAFLAMFLANFCTVASFGVFFLFPLFISEHGGSEGDIGMIMGIFALASALCRPWVSEMIDRIGRKKSYLVGCLLMTLLPLCYLTYGGELQSFYLPLLLVRIVHGIGLAICFTAIFTFVADVVPQNRLNEGIGIFGTSGLIGLAIGPLLAEMTLHRYGFSAMFLLAGLLAATALLITLRLPENFTARSEPGPGFFRVLARRKQLVIGLLALLFGFGLAASGNFVAPMAKARQFPFISLYFLAYSAAAVSIRFVGGRLADRIGEARMLPYALVITAAGLLALILVKGQVSFFVAGILAGAGHGLLFPTLNTLAIRNEPQESRGKITGIFTGGIDSGAFLGALILGYIGEWGGFDLLFATAGTVLLFGLLVLWFCPETRPTHSSPN